jgi:hypothetical protein
LKKAPETKESGRPEPVEGRPFFSAAQEEEVRFDKLSAIGVGYKVAVTA